MDVGYLLKPAHGPECPGLLLSDRAKAKVTAKSVVKGAVRGPEPSRIRPQPSPCASLWFGCLRSGKGQGSQGHVEGWPPSEPSAQRRKRYYCSAIGSFEPMMTHAEQPASGLYSPGPSVSAATLGKRDGIKPTGKSKSAVHLSPGARGAGLRYEKTSGSDNVSTLQSAIRGRLEASCATSCSVYQTIVAGISSRSILTESRSHMVSSGYLRIPGELQIPHSSSEATTCV